MLVLQSRNSYLFLLLVLGLAGLSGYLYTIKPFQLGLDVQGGVRFTYQMDLSKLSAEQRQNIPQLRARLITILERRAGGNLGVVEPQIVPKGEDQIVVELPSFRDVKTAREVIGQQASIKWYHAKNVAAGTSLFRPYQDLPRDSVGGKPEVHFQKRTGDTKPITPADPEYQRIIDGWGQAIIEGDELQSANIETQGDSFIPKMNFTPEGAEKMRRWTTANRYKGEKLAAVLDDVVISIAPLEPGSIISSEAVITGEFDRQYVSSLVELLNSGALPVSLIELQSQTIDPTIGKHALNMIVTAGAISLAFTGLFLLVYYVFPGLIALIALLLYMLFTLTALKLANATFSLASIAGFILSIGMAVDANILVFERMKEEMREGKSLNDAIRLAFSRAFPAILDSNVCTIITSFVLAQVGTGPVKGFASTLVIGVIISLFTAVVVTRSLLQFLVGSGLGSNPKWYGLERQWFGEGLEAKADKEPIQVVNHWKRYFIISAITIVPGVIFLALGGIRPNVEFQGGYEGSYPLRNAQVTSQQIVDNLERNGIKGANVKFADAGGQIGRLAIVTVPDTPQLKNAEDASGTLATAAGLQAGEGSSFQAVGGTVRAETISGAVKGVVVSSILIVVYLAIRFGLALGGFLIGLRFALAAIGALIHDVIVVIGLAAIMGYLAGWEISALFISAMLTVIGFSTHDTIVIFDRIRENLRRPLPNENVEHLFNRSITQSFARSINTSMTVIVTLCILIGFGSATPDLRLMNAAMLIGIISGTYSSIFNAAPILYLWDKAIGKKKGEAATLLGSARAHQANLRVPSVRVDTPATEAGPAAGYSQVRRRASSVNRSRTDIDEQP